MKKQFRTAMLSTACMLIVAVMSLTGVTYAWFTQGTSAVVNGMSMQVTTADGGVLIAAMNSDGTWENYATQLELDLNRTSVSPVSSTDGRNFYQLQVNPANDQEVKSVTYTPTNTTTSNVITQRLKLKNPGAEKITVVLDSENSTITQTGTTVINEAARVALIVTDEAGTANTTVYIWTPYDGEYVGIKSTTTDWVSLSAGIIPSTASCVETKKITSAEDCAIELPGFDADTGLEKEVFVTVVIWLEGQDANCVNKNAGGAFDVQLQFIQEAAPVDGE